LHFIFANNIFARYKFKFKLKILSENKIVLNGRDFSRFNGLNPLIKEVPKGIPTDKIPTDKRKPEGISFIG